MTTSDVDVGDPRVYCVRANGHLDDTWVSRIAWVDVAREIDGDGKAVTVLTGALPDQSALLGMVNLLFDLGLEIVSIQTVEDPHTHSSMR